MRGTLLLEMLLLGLAAGWLLMKIAVNFALGGLGGFLTYVVMFAALGVEHFGVLLLGTVVGAVVGFIR